MSCRALAERFGYSPDSVERHSRAHLLPQMRAAILAGQHPSQVERTSESEGLLANVLAQHPRLHSIGELALELQDVRAAVSVEAAVTAKFACRKWTTKNYHSSWAAHCLSTDDAAKIVTPISDSLSQI